MRPQERLCRIRAKDDENLLRPPVDCHNCPAEWTLIFAPIRIENRQYIVRLNSDFTEGRLGYLRVGRAGVHPRVKRKAVATLSTRDGDMCLESSHAAIVHATYLAAIICPSLLVVP